MSLPAVSDPKNPSSRNHFQFALGSIETAAAYLLRDASILLTHLNVDRGRDLVAGARGLFALAIAADPRHFVDNTWRRERAISGDGATGGGSRFLKRKSFPFIMEMTDLRCPARLPCPRPLHLAPGSTHDKRVPRAIQKDFLKTRPIKLYSQSSSLDMTKEQKGTLFWDTLYSRAHLLPLKKNSG